MNEILKFYTDDFVHDHAKNLIEYAQRYTDQTLPKESKVEFLPYDWSIANNQRK